MSFFNGCLLVLGVVLIWMGMPTLGGGLVFAVVWVGLCDEFGNSGRHDRHGRGGHGGCM